MRILGGGFLLYAVLNFTFRRQIETPVLLRHQHFAVLDNVQLLGIFEASCLSGMLSC